MKKLICVFVALAMLVVFPLTGCGGDDTDAMKAPVDGFLSSMQAGDFETMKTYADPSLFEEGGSLEAFNTLENIDEELASSLGISTSDLSDKTKQEVDSYVKDMMSKMIKSYEITDVAKGSDTEGTVSTKVTFGFDPEAASSVDVNSEMESVIEKYMQDNMTELTQVYQSGGQKALMVKVLDDLCGDLLKIYTDKVMETGEVTEDVVFNVENKDGSWLIVSEESGAL